MSETFAAITEISVDAGSITQRARREPRGDGRDAVARGGVGGGATHAWLELEQPRNAAAPRAMSKVWLITRVLCARLSSSLGVDGIRACFAQAADGVRVIGAAAPLRAASATLVARPREPSVTTPRARAPSEARVNGGARVRRARAAAVQLVLDERERVSGAAREPPATSTRATSTGGCRRSRRPRGCALVR